MAENEFRVLLIEDNPGDAKLVSMMLARSKGVSFHLETRDRLTPGLERLAQGGIDALLLDLSLPDSHGFETFDRAQAAVPLLPIVLLSSLDDETVAMRAVERGAQDYLIKGRVDDHSLSRALRFAMQRQKKQAADLHRGHAAEEGARFLVLVGAKGGVGTTTLALNLAACVAWAKRSVVAVELRPDYGTFSYQLAMTPAKNLSHLLALEPDQINEGEINSCLTKLPSGLQVLFGPQAIREFKPVEAARAEALLSGLAGLADFIVIDLPAAFPAASQAAARYAHFAGLLVDADPGTVAAAKVTLEQMCSAGASRSLLKAVVVDHSPLEHGLRVNDIASQLDCRIFGTVPQAAELCMRSQRAGSPFVLSEPNSIASVAIYEMAYKLLSHEAARVGA